MAAKNTALLNEIVRLRYDEGLSKHIIARRLKVTTGVVAGHLWRHRHPSNKTPIPRERSLYTVCTGTKLDQETEIELRQATADMKVSRSEAIRLLIEWGLDDLRKYR